MSTSARLLALLALLQSPRARPGGELAERLEVDRRTIRRDVDRLRDLGYPVEATIGREGGYRLAAGTAMPPLLLDDEEAVAIAVGLRTATGGVVAGIDEASVRALAKLEQVLPPRLRARVTAIGAATAPLTWDGPTVDPAVLTTIARAIPAGERIRFAYRSSDGAPTRREVEPHGLVVMGRRWYLVGWDVDRADWRSFRVDRLTDPWTTRVHGPRHELPDGLDPAGWLRREHLAQAPTFRMVATVDAPAGVVATRMGDAAETIEPLGDARCRVTGAGDTLPWLAFRLLLLEAEFQVVEPAELREYVAGLGDRLRRSSSAAVSPGPAPAASRSRRAPRRRAPAVHREP